MFRLAQAELLNNLEDLRKRLCPYVGGTSCDCKYGASGKGEQTGCPELRAAMELLGG